MSMMFNTSQKPGLAQRIGLRLAVLRMIVPATFSGRRGAPVRLDDEENQIELLRLAHHRREEIRRSGEELRLLGVRR